MGFPLKDWIDAHADLPHHLGHSGMIGTLRRVARALGHPAAPDPAALRRELADSLAVGVDRVFLTHGATEGNTAVLFHLSRVLRGRLGRAPRGRVPVPDYPPLREITRRAGFRLVPPSAAADVLVLSAPNNPTGLLPDLPAEDSRGDGVRAILADETFREFTEAPSLARRGDRRIWTTGTFTKVYGADDLRVGYIVTPPEAVTAFGAFHGIALDEVPPASIAGARAILADRPSILGEARGRFLHNRAALGRAVPDLPPLAAPVWFDRVADGDALARAAIRRGVLVCPGSFFGRRRGVRLCLTQTSFPADLAAYLAVRTEVYGGGASPSRRAESTPRRAAGASQ